MKKLSRDEENVEIKMYSFIYIIINRVFIYVRIKLH